MRSMTVSSRNCSRSKVVKRKLQVRQTRRRRMTAESSVGRESFTCVSRLPQLGQRMLPPYPACNASLINRKALQQRADLVANLRLDQRVLVRVLLRQDVAHLDDPVADLLEFGDAE